MTDDHGAAGNIPPGLRVPRNQMSRRAIRYWSALAVVHGAVLLGAELGIEAAVGLGPGCWSAFGASAFLVLGYVLVMPRWRFRVHRWEVTEDALYTRSGWFAVRWRIAPINRIQTIDSSRSLPERVFRLANVTATTASTAGHIRIHGLDVETADRLQSELSLATARTAGDAT
jgi:membrane protein YdbS with pleckstrin-like domain